MTPAGKESAPGLDRRTFLRSATGGFLAAGIAAAAPAGAAVQSPDASVGVASSRRWLGPAYWANRLQDWQYNRNRLECVAGAGRRGLRTVAILTRELVAGPVSAQLTVRTGTLAAGAGFSGFLIGVGGGALDYRAAALAQAASGQGGGLLCVYEADGTVGFREHTNEADQFAYAPIATATAGSKGPARSLSESLELQLSVIPAAPGTHDLTMVVVNAVTGTRLSSGTLPGVADSDLVGGVSLVSSPLQGSAARHWFKPPIFSGSKVVAHDDRGAGPIFATLFSATKGVLKLTAQFTPVGTGDPQAASLEFRRVGTTDWQVGPTASIGPAFAAQFRVEGWDSSTSWDYRVVYGAGTALAQAYAGRIPAEPATGDELSLTTLNCSIHSFRPLDAPSSGSSRLAGEHFLGLYTDANLYFPYAATVGTITSSQPDMLVALGDQFYETRPTSKDPSSAPVLDFLYRYYLWLWSFRELTAVTPSIILVDDHDMYQGNIWGHSGAAAPNGDYGRGGYVKAPSWINAVQAAQCGHNPDPYDATPVLQGITVYYTSFVYGGVSFAVLEDRKFKSGDADGLDSSGAPFPASELQLLGERQEQFLSAWAATEVGLPKVCLTQTMLGCLQTTLDGQPAVDYDSNGYPPDGRTRAVQLLKSAGAVVLCGDQHLGAVVRHGLTTFTDGPVQFMAPALGAGFARWFEPAATLPNGAGLPYTGDFTDGFGNRLRVLAVANPVVSRAVYAAGYGSSAHSLGDRFLKREGYGVLRVQPAAGMFVLECWPWNAGTPLDVSQQYPGWPITVAFADA